MQPMQLFDNNAIKIHLLGFKEESYPRPWASANANNPLAAWAEKKKEEQAAREAESRKESKKDQ